MAIRWWCGQGEDWPILELLWILVCTVVGAGIGAGLLYGLTQSLGLTVLGAVLGLLLGGAFGKLVPAHEVLIDLLG